MYDPTKPYKQKIISLIQDTWETPYVSVSESTYPIIRKKFAGLEVDHTDGIGTKGIYHWQKRTLEGAALDALAMNLNDLAIVQARPYKIQNHITLPRDDHEAILEIVEVLSRECKKRNIAITGGETSIHSDASGLDISVTLSGFLEEKRENRFEPSDLLIGIKSNGLHANGFTKVRETLGEKYRKELTDPTAIYLDVILETAAQCEIHGAMHITGGAYTKLKDVAKNTDVTITRTHFLQPQNIFRDLYDKGIPDEDMYKTFNCGIGFIFSVSPESAKRILPRPNMDIIGRVSPGTGLIQIESMFNNKTIEF